MQKTRDSKKKLAKNKKRSDSICIRWGTVPLQELRKVAKKMTREQINQLISAGVARSWLNKEVKEKRLTRNPVRCNGKVYDSVGHAFCWLHLNMGKHIKFRMRLKQELTATYVENGQKYQFELLPSYRL